MTSDMRPLIRRILLFRPFRPPSRMLTQLHHLRPELPFLCQPQSQSRQIRFLTTERKAWLKDELRKGVRYTVTGWLIFGLLAALVVVVQHEWLETKFSSPPEWSLATRMKFRSAKWEEDHDDDANSDVGTDWARAGNYYRDLLERLENPNIDGAGLGEQDEGGILVAGVGKTGYDISKKPESWRRGYYQVLMGVARSAEHLDGWVRDRTTNIAFPASVVIGPSNPNPRPVSPGGALAPNEEDCETAFEPPETYYVRVLTTRGFTEKQRLDAALAYATWLDYKATPQAAEDMFKWALDIAASSFPSTQAIFTSNGTLQPTAEPPSANILSAATALAIHHARTTHLDLALPIFLSILRSRRSLPTAPSKNLSTVPPTGKDPESSILSIIVSTLTPSTYPPPPPDGTLPPARDALSRCEEAALMVYIGEILYATAYSSTARQTDARREEGLAWTREAVDIAEEVLQSSSRIVDSDGRGEPKAMRTGIKTGKSLTKMTRKTCSQCLEAGLGNWAKMVHRLAAEESEMREVRESLAQRKKPGEIVQSSKAASLSFRWLSWAGNIGLGNTWGSKTRIQDEEMNTIGQNGQERKSIPSRWESEELVIRERIRRARNIIRNAG